MHFFLISIIFCVILPQFSRALTADLVLQCDNYGDVTRWDNGVGPTLLGSVTSWPTPFTSSLTGVTASTVIRMKCYDVGVIGGFVAQITYDGIEYYTTNPLSDGNWEVTDYQGSTGSAPSLVYYRQGTHIWGGSVSSQYNYNAQWVWNSQTYNWMEFEFDFGNILCAHSGLYEFSTPHACECQSSCTGSYCNSRWYVLGRLGQKSYIKDEDLCPPYESCCCSCSNCPYWITI